MKSEAGIPIEAIPFGTVVLNREGLTINRINSLARALLERCGIPCGCLAEEWPRLKEVHPQEREFSFVERYTLEDRSQLEISVTVDSAGGDYLYLYLQDKTREAQEERRLNDEVQHRRVLSREINHRVTNNLAIVSSLISLKTSQLGDPDLLEDLRLQIEAIRSIHRLLIENDEHLMIQMKTYLMNIVETACTAFGCDDVELNLAIEEIELNSKQAATLGLIVNELVTNAGKYAFRESMEDDKLRVEFRQEQNELRLTVENSGPPLPDALDPAHSEGLGMRLIWALTGELGGTLELRRRPTPRFTIRFPYPPMRNTNSIFASKSIRRPPSGSATTNSGPKRPPS